MTAISRAARWREQMEERSRRVAEEVVSVPVMFDGFEGRAHRLRLTEWAQAGKLPQYLTSAMFAAVRGQATEVRRNDLTPEQLFEYLKFQASAFCAMMDDPKFSTEEMRAGRPLGEDELDYAEFCLMFPVVVKQAVQWQLDGCPDIPIQTESGEVSIEDLENFRDGGEGASIAESGFNRAGVWWDTRPTPRTL